MASATTAVSSTTRNTILCKFYMNGVCRDGSSCRYSHDRENSAPDMVCRYYLQGCCSYGTHCRYDHVKPRPVSPHPTVSPSFQSTPYTISPVPQNSHPELPDFQSYVPENTESKLIDLWDQDIQDDLENLYSPSLWSSAPSTSDKVILRGGRIKTKADWAKDSPVFVPQTSANVPALSYAQVADSSAAPKDPSLDHSETLPCYLSENFDEICNDFPKPTYTENELCPYLAHGACPNMEQCCYVHGDVCEMCGLNVLHPTDVEQRQKHEMECLREHEANMEYSFLVAQSKDKECSICMEVVFEKAPPENRFGLLPNCNHVFCLTCIRKWRSSTLEKDVIRRCPECRITSNYVTPSNVWIEDKETKEKIITNYKETMKNKPCKYFDQGRKMCPFSDSCFYLHAYPDGTIATPDQHVRQRQRADANGRVSTVNSHSLWDFIYQREQSSFYDDDDLSFSPVTTDSDSEDIS